MQKIIMAVEKIFGIFRHEESKSLVLSSQRSLVPLNVDRLRQIKSRIIGTQNRDSIEGNKKIKDSLLESLNVSKGKNLEKEKESEPFGEELYVPAGSPIKKKISDYKKKNEEIISSIKSQFGLERVNSERILKEDYPENKNKAYFKGGSKDNGAIEMHRLKITPRAISKTVANKDNIIRHLKEVHKHG